MNGTESYSSIEQRVRKELFEPVDATTTYDIGVQQYDPSKQFLCAVYFIADGGCHTIGKLGVFNKGVSDDCLTYNAIFCEHFNYFKTSLLIVKFDETWSYADADRMAFSKAWTEVADIICDDAGYTYVVPFEDFTKCVDELIEHYVEERMAA